MREEPLRELPPDERRLVDAVLRDPVLRERPFFVPLLAAAVVRFVPLLAAAGARRCSRPRWCDWRAIGWTPRRRRSRRAPERRAPDALPAPLLEGQHTLGTALLLFERALDCRCVESAMEAFLFGEFCTSVPGRQVAHARQLQLGFTRP